MTANTPLDDLAVKLADLNFNRSTSGSEKLIDATVFIQVCRAKYQQLHRAAETLWERNGKLFRDNGITSITTKEYLDDSLDLVETKLAYFSFLDELNKFGRFLSNRYGVELPSYKRVRFYRNKMIEHWDEYTEYLANRGDGFMFQNGKLVSPYHSGDINKPQVAEASYNSLKAEFKAMGVDLPVLSLGLTTDHRYSEVVFTNLELIDTDLGRKIPDTLVEALFKFCFPIPIKDLDQYFIDLNEWLTEFCELIEIR